jgi:murein DD-endopeptidase MepM/ murein hydrolase activator NlpD
MIGVAALFLLGLSTASPAIPSRAMFAYPLKGEGRATSGFGVRTDPFTGRTALHRGQDIAARMSTPVVAARAGTVESVGQQGGYGNRIQIDHGDAVRTVYGQLSRIDVKPGDSVAAGQIIGAVGSTGRSTGPHLHFEVWEGEVATDPYPLIQWPSKGPVAPE